jgi:hypothetical protein
VLSLLQGSVVTSNIVITEWFGKIDPKTNQLLRNSSLNVIWHDQHISYFKAIPYNRLKTPKIFAVRIGIVPDPPPGGSRWLVVEHLRVGLSGLRLLGAHADPMTFYIFNPVVVLIQSLHSEKSCGIMNPAGLIFTNSTALTGRIAVNAD